jgi:RNA polymerase sigma-70 factor (ECF subfamily)
MMFSMSSDIPSSVQTRSSLLNRLKQGDDAESWQQFYRVYGKVVRDFAIRSGLTDTEADEVVQETAIAMARHLPEYKYDPSVCRFKTWLLNQASWRIKDQIKKRKKEPGWQSVRDAGLPTPALCDDTKRTALACQVPDPSAMDLDAVFEDEWRKSLFASAVEKVRERFSPRQFQIFELVVLKEWPAAEVAKSLAVSTAHVHLTRHRIAAAVKQEARRLEKQLERAVQIRSNSSEPMIPASKAESSRR